jgi:hypothetical protein
MAILVEIVRLSDRFHLTPAPTQIFLLVPFRQCSELLQELVLIYLPFRR